jgi:hypothetical protein
LFPSAIVTLEADNTPVATMAKAKRRKIFVFLVPKCPNNGRYHATMICKAAGAVQLVAPVSQIIVMVWLGVMLDGDVNWNV